MSVLAGRVQRLRPLSTWVIPVSQATQQEPGPGGAGALSAAEASRGEREGSCTLCRGAGALQLCSGGLCVLGEDLAMVESNAERPAWEVGCRLGRRLWRLSKVSSDE